MENLWEYSPRFRRDYDQCSGTLGLITGQEAVVCGFTRSVWLCRNHAKRLQKQNLTSCCFKGEKIVVTARTSSPVLEGRQMFSVSCLTTDGVHFCAKITSTFWTRTLGLPTMNCKSLPRSEWYTPIVLRFDLNCALILKSTYLSNFNPCAFVYCRGNVTHH